MKFAWIPLLLLILLSHTGYTQQPDNTYQKALNEANEYYKAKDYKQARIFYQKALEIKPDAAFPKIKLKQINKIYTDPEEIKSYNTCMSKGEDLLKSASYTQALKLFEEAKKIFPSRAETQTKIDETKALIENQQAVLIQYNTALSQADTYYKQEQWTLALQAYQNATKIKSTEQYPLKQIQLIEDKLQKLSSIQSQYDRLIQSADEFYIARNFNAAREKYLAAKNIKPNESYPVNMLQKVDNGIATQASAREEYTIIITNADMLRSQNSLNEAMQAYKTAASLMPEESYPGQQIALLEQRITNEKELENQYNQLITKADELFTNKALEQAHDLYQQASTLKTTATYPAEQLIKIEQEQTLQQQNNKEADYSNYITQADLAYANDDLDIALKQYKQAQNIKPDNAYVTSQIEAIKTIRLKQEEDEQQYNLYMSQGQNLLNSQKYTQAKEQYLLASNIFPKRTECKGEIDKIDKLLNELNERETNYTRAIKEGDEALAKGNLQEAANAYSHAHNLISSEEYPIKKMEEISSQQASASSQKEQLNSAILQSKEYLNNQQYSKALEIINVAISLDPGNNELTSLKKEIKEKQIAHQSQTISLQQQLAKYQPVIEQADHFFNLKKYGEAQQKYKEASEILPDEAYPIERINEVKRLLQQQNDIAEAYNNSIQRANRFFDSQQWEKAFDEYQTAQTLNPASDLANERILLLKQMLKDLLKNKEAYNQIIAHADALMNSQDYSDAIKAYESASLLMPYEQYPKQQLSNIQIIQSNKMRSIRSEYDNCIIQADNAWSSRRLDHAIHYYKEALAFQPSDSYASNMIDKINQYISENSIITLEKGLISLNANESKRFYFNPLTRNQKKNCYLVFKAKATAEGNNSIIISYGRFNYKNGGFSLRNITVQENQEFIIRLSTQDKWYREENGWISLDAQGGQIAIYEIKITQCIE